MSNKLQFVAASHQRHSARKAQQTEVDWTPENLIFRVLTAGNFYRHTDAVIARIGQSA